MDHGQRRVWSIRHHEHPRGRVSEFFGAEGHARAARAVARVARTGVLDVSVQMPAETE